MPFEWDLCVSSGGADQRVKGLERVEDIEGMSVNLMIICTASAPVLTGQSCLWIKTEISN